MVLVWEKRKWKINSEWDGWPLQSPGKPLSSLLHPGRTHGSPTSREGALSGFRQPSSLSAAPVSKSHGWKLQRNQFDSSPEFRQPTFPAPGSCFGFWSDQKLGFTPSRYRHNPGLDIATQHHRQSDIALPHSGLYISRLSSNNPVQKIAILSCFQERGEKKKKKVTSNDFMRAMFPGVFNSMITGPF